MAFIMISRREYCTIVPLISAQLSNSSLEKLNNILSLQVGKLEVVYSLKHCPRDPPVILQEICRLIKESEFSILRDHVGVSLNCAEINRELARFFSLGNPQCLKEIRYQKDTS